MSRARAAVLTAPRTIEVQEFEVPSTGPDDGLLRVEACGVCGADYSSYAGAAFGDEMLGMRVPVVLGHEICGEVVEIGERASRRWGVGTGDRIILERWIPCGSCDRCLTGDYRLCIRHVDGLPLFYGGSPTSLAPSLWGGYAEVLYLHPDAVVYPLDDRIPSTLAPFFTPMANAISWVQKTGGAGIGSTVVIQGPGQEGLAAVVAARAAGAGTVVVTGLRRDAFRLGVARELGATHTVVVEDGDVVEQVREATRGRLADVVLDVTAGATGEPFLAALAMAREGGTVVVSALHNGVRAEVPIDRIMEKVLTVRGVRGRDRASVRAALALMASGRYPLRRLCTHEFSLEETDEAIRTVGGEGTGEALHVSVVPGLTASA